MCSKKKMVNHRRKLKTIKRNTSRTLGNHFEWFVESSISTGRFNNASEVERAGLRPLEEEEYRVSLLRNALQEGMKSGRAVDFDPKKHLGILKSSQKNG